VVEASFCRYKSQLYWSKSLAALVAKWQTLPFLKDFHIESGNFPVLDLIGVSQKKQQLDVVLVTSWYGSKERHGFSGFLHHFPLANR
jgi:hypothetical protein